MDLALCECIRLSCLLLLSLCTLALLRCKRSGRCRKASRLAWALPPSINERALLLHSLYQATQICIRTSLSAVTSVACMVRRIAERVAATADDKQCYECWPNEQSAGQVNRVEARNAVIAELARKVDRGEKFIGC